MSNRQERKARKAAQRAGTEAFVHVKPTERRLAPIPVIQDDSGRIHRSMRAVRLLARRYNVEIKDERQPDGRI